ncbi:MAG TPA: hypothetical protein VM869_30515 [Enhygromyxa sp.]|nr:hypothetical protein [Enhygromyxa sp.]
MNYEFDTSNPYAAPTAGGETGAGRGFAFSDELRQLISSTASLMIVAGALQMIPGVLMLITNGISAWSLVSTAMFGIAPIFTAIAGFSLRALGKPGNDQEALHSGLRALFVPFLVKGIIMLLVVGLMLLNILLMVIGIGTGFVAMWD